MQRNTSCRFAATVLLMTVTLGAASGGAFAQDGEAVATTPFVADARYPNADDVASAFQTLRLWIDQFETPRMDDAASRVALGDATGVCIVLRRFGRVLGTGVDIGGDELMLRRAAGRALNEVLSDPALASLSAKLRQHELENDQAALTVDALRAEIGRTLSIELEVAGRLSPLLGRSVEHFARRLEPGLDGVGLRHQGALELIFPAQLRATNTGVDPVKPLFNLALKAGLSVREIPDLGRRDDLALYSFRTVTLAQSAPDAAPVRTHRGDVRVPIEAVHRESIGGLADGIAAHIVTRLWPDPPPAPNGSPNSVGRQPYGLMGDYSIVADHYRPLLAPPLDQALAAMALHQYAQAAPAGVDAGLAERAAEVSARLWRDLAAVDTAEENPAADLAACAAIVFGIASHPPLRNDQDINQLFKTALQRVNDSFDPASGFIDRTVEGRAHGIAAHTQAMIAAAMSRWLLESRTMALDAPRVRRALDAAWQSVPQVQHVSLLPWIGWAEADYARATGQPLAHADELQLLLDVMDEIRIRAGTRNFDLSAADLDGGLVLVSETATVPVATAQTVRPAAWAAGALRDVQLVPRNKAELALERHLLTMRFLMQLTVRQEHRAWLRTPSRAIGGLRAALWNSDQPLPAQAIGLITAVETLKTLTELHPAAGVQPN